MTNLVTQALRAREGGATRRCHTIPWIGHYDVAQHTFNMLTLLDLLAPDDVNDFQVIRHVLWHDVHERWTGDVPAGLRYFHPDVRKNFKLAKREVNERFGFPDDLREDGEARAWVRALDQLEFYLACQDQKALGNRNVDPYLRGVEEWFDEAEGIPDQVVCFFREFRWERTSQRLSRSSTLPASMRPCYECGCLHPQRQPGPPFLCEDCQRRRREDATYEQRES
jgi:5'-deoxynucleotidase YfbR-like HD superfamily hydrolase